MCWALVVLLAASTANSQDISPQQALADEIYQLALIDIEPEEKGEMASFFTSFSTDKLMKIMIEDCRGSIELYSSDPEFGRYLAVNVEFDLYGTNLQMDAEASKFYFYHPHDDSDWPPKGIEYDADGEGSGVLVFIFSSPNSGKVRMRRGWLTDEDEFEGIDPNTVPFKDVSQLGFWYIMDNIENEERIKSLADKFLEYQRTYCPNLS